MRTHSFRIIRRALAATLIGAHAANANVVGTDAQNFNSITSGLDFVTVQSSETLEPGIFNLGFFLNYAVNTLPYFEGSQTQSRVNFNDTLLGADLNMGVGLMRNWDVGISLPHVVAQSVESNTNAHGQFAETGMTEIRLNSKVRLLGDREGGFGFVGSVNFNQIQDNPFTGRDAGPTFNLEAVADRTFGKVAAAVNVGYRWRSPGDAIPNVGIEPFQNQLIASAAANYLLTDLDTKLIFEVFGSMPAKRVNYDADRRQSSLEGLAGIKHDLTPQLAVHAGGGTELMHGNASPDWRVYTGVNYTFGPVFSKPQDVTRVESRTEVPSNADPFSGTPQAAIETFVVRNILFEFDSDRLQEQSKETLDRLVDYLMKPPEYQRLEISGHTDSVGSAVYNLDLSQRRARSVREYLVKQRGLDPKRVEAYGYGEGLPIADNGNYQGRAMNRRVEFKIFRDTSTEPGEISAPPPVPGQVVPTDTKHTPPQKPVKMPPKASPKPGTKKPKAR